MNHKFYILLITTLFTCYKFSVGQMYSDEVNASPQIILPIVARSYSDSIILRWSASNTAGWLLGRDKGYKIERAELMDGITDYSKLNFVAIETSPVLKYTEPQLADYFNNHEESHPDYDPMAIIYNIFYESDENAVNNIPNVFSQDLNSLKEERDRLNFQFTLALFSSDASKLAAKAAGVTTTDTNVEPGKTYVYKISLISKSDVYEIQPGFIKVKCEAFDPQKYIKEVFKQEQDTRIMLGWPKSEISNTFFIERALDKNGPFTRLEAVPKLTQSTSDSSKIQGSYLDDSLTNYTTYYYKVIGRSYFGDEILVGEVAAMPRDLTPPQKPFLEQPIQISEDEVELKWLMEGELDNDFAGYNVGRANNMDGPYLQLNTSLLASNVNSFIDTSFVKGMSNIYIIQAFDTAGNFSISRFALVTLIDSIPPETPVFLRGEIDSTGIVTLYLKQNNEADLMGYRVFKANSLNDEPSVFFETFNYDSVAIAMDTVIIDSISLKTLTKNIYYYATALDDHYNESPLSEPIKIQKPDTIAPVMPMIGDYFVKEKAIELELYPSPSADVVEHRIYRRHMEKEADLTIYRILPKEVYKFVDTNVLGKQNYVYGFTAIDDFGLESKMNTPIQLKTYKIDSLPSVNFNAKYFPTDKQVVIDWVYEHAIPEEYTFSIYKKPAGENWQLVTTVKKDAAYKVVDKVKTGTTQIEYRVSVKSRYVQSIKNPVVTVSIP